LKIGRRKGGQGGQGWILENPPWILKLLAKKIVFSISRAETQISPLLAPPGKNFGKILYWPPWKKSSRSPWIAVEKFLTFAKSCLCPTKTS